ncbi:hypothetical protein Halru_0917 [Halovivax ruber XH-70]|uniref:Uncharacterized protein n=1 Tax=Halovivax ruber (strain DSM 18193 / JCM 13892 / XH-70) TaxID=797302 RepID=L0I9N4_HALRX|nr:hypothetical protein [Halovivax ruber]AGB15538.1 hypothetical protein Halru_0917 [Halovivax ruber XH-70]
MVGTTLVELRQYIESLASEAGDFSLVCCRTGDRPVPAVGHRFDSRAIARRAARATDCYRSALRRYDPRLPYYDIIVCQGPLVDSPQPAQSDAIVAEADSDTGAWSLSEPVINRTHSGIDHRALAEFCHRVAGTVFEALSDSGFDSVETAVMDEYVRLAETVVDPDELCLRLLESMATELDERLSAEETRTVLACAATRLPEPETTGDPLRCTFDSLRECGLFGRYVRSLGTADAGTRTRSVVVRIAEYALSPRRGVLPTLPIALELYRHGGESVPSSIRVQPVDDDWEFTFELRTAGVDVDDSGGLLSAPISR